MKKHSKLRIRCMYALLSSILLFAFIVQSASDYDRAFIQKPLEDITVTALSPYKNSQGIQFQPVITSKNNQPRYVSGTNPHRGTDMSIKTGEPIYPIYDGKIVYMNKDISSQSGHVIIESDIGGELVYIEYLHIAPLQALNEGDYVYACIPIGVVDSYKKYDCHLHIGRVDKNNEFHYQFYDIFSHVKGWNYGSDMDVFSHPKYSKTSGVLSITAYVSSDTDNTDYYGGYGRFALEKITFHYSVNNGQWQKYDITEYTDNFVYSFNIKEITKAKSQDLLKYYITGTRDNDSIYDTTFKDAPYKICYYPAFYSHPEQNITAIQAERMCLALTIE